MECGRERQVPMVKDQVELIVQPAIAASLLPSQHRCSILRCTVRPHLDFEDLRSECFFRAGFSYAKTKNLFRVEYFPSVI